MKEKVVDEFFYKIEHIWKDKENLPELIDDDLREVGHYFGEEEKVTIK